MSENSGVLNRICPQEKLFYQSLTNIGGEGNGTPLQYSCLGNPMDGGAWWTAVHGVAKSRTQLSDFTFTFHFHALEKEMATHSSVLAWRIPGTGAWWAAVYGSSSTAPSSPPLARSPFSMVSGQKAAPRARQGPQKHSRFGTVKPRGSRSPLGERFTLRGPSGYGVRVP